ncbi:MAG: hypothetical protein CMP27_00380 [Roseibacillus sp.]|nr:hypothetical protein [Roseibacillus sp.]
MRINARIVALLQLTSTADDLLLLCNKSSCDCRSLRQDVVSLVMFFLRRRRGQWSWDERAMDAQVLADLRRQRVDDFVL